VILAPFLPFPRGDGIGKDQLSLNMSIRLKRLANVASFFFPRFSSRRPLANHVLPPGRRLAVSSVGVCIFSFILSLGLMRVGVVVVRLALSTLSGLYEA